MVARHARRLTAVAVVLLLGAVVATAAYSRAAGGSGAAADATTLNYGQVFDVSTMDPAAAFDNISWRVTRNVYDTLVYDKLGTSSVQPGLAKSWKITKNNTVFTFSLRPSKFTDGNPVDANAVKYSFERTIKINKGPATFIRGIKSIRVLNPSTIQFTLKSPSIFFLQKTTKIGIVSPKAVQAHIKGNDLGETWLRYNVVGSGAYMLESFTPNQQVVIKQNPTYWRGWKGKHVTRVVMRLLKTAGAARQLLTRGELDMAANIPLQDQLELRKSSGIRFVTAPQNALDVLTLNTSKGVLKDRRVRQAVTLAFPFDQMVNGAHHGYAKVPNGPLPSGMFGWNKSLPKYKQDIAKAKQLLAAAGHPNGGFTLTCVILANSVDFQNEAQLLQSGLSQIGVKLNIKQLSFPAVLALMDNQKTAEDIAANYLGAYSIDPIVYLGQLFKGSNIGRGTEQWTYLRNNELDATLNKAEVAKSPAELKRLLGKAQKIIRDEWAAIPTSEPQFTDAVSTKVQGYKFNPSDYFFIPRFWDISKTA
jgi:peptide/nickel transport system substrate-binding protein